MAEDLEGQPAPESGSRGSEKANPTGDKVKIPPEPDRIVAVACGLARWTPEEAKWLESHPRMKKAFLKLMDAAIDFKVKHLRSTSHVDSIKPGEDARRDEPPSR